VSRTFRTSAIILKRSNLNEADRLITVFSQNQGKLKLIAKGIRKLTSRKKGHLELFTLSKLLIAKTKTLDIVTEAQTIKGFPELRKNLNRVRIAYLLAELVDKLTPENQDHPEIYHLLIENFSKLNSNKAPKNLILDFEINLLKILGFGLPKTITRQSLESHIAGIIEKPLNSKKIT